MSNPPLQVSIAHEHGAPPQPRSNTLTGRTRPNELGYFPCPPTGHHNTLGHISEAKLLSATRQSDSGGRRLVYQLFDPASGWEAFPDADKCSVGPCTAIEEDCDSGHSCVAGQCLPAAPSCEDNNDANWDGCANGVSAEQGIPVDDELVRNRPTIAKGTSATLILWERYGAMPDLDPNVLEGLLVPDDGAGELAFAVDDCSEHDCVSPAAAWLDDTALLTWQRKLVDGVHWAIRSQLYDLAGKPINAVQTLSPPYSNELAEHYRPCVAVGVDGSILVAWTARYHGGVLAHWMDPSGWKGDTTIPLGDGLGLSQPEVSVGLRSDKTIALAWTQCQESLWHPEDIVATSLCEVRLAWFNEAGDLLQPSQVVGPNVLGVQYRPSLAVLGSGDTAVAWEMFDVSSQSPRVYLRVYDGEGQPMSAPLSLGEGMPAFRRNPSVFPSGKCNPARFLSFLASVRPKLVAFGR